MFIRQAMLAGAALTPQLCEGALRSARNYYAHQRRATLPQGDDAPPPGNHPVKRDEACHELYTIFEPRCDSISALHVDFSIGKAWTWGAGPSGKLLGSRLVEVWRNHPDSKLRQQCPETPTGRFQPSQRGHSEQGPGAVRTAGCVVSQHQRYAVAAETVRLRVTPSPIYPPLFSLHPMGNFQLQPSIMAYIVLSKRSREMYTESSRRGRDELRFLPSPRSILE